MAIHSSPCYKTGMTPDQEAIITRIVLCPTTGCWRWTAGLGGRGYGCYGAKKKAHRFSYEAFNGPIPVGLHVRHTCDVKDCVNPAHLLVGTHWQNMQDAKNRHRMPGPSPREKCKRGHDLTISGARYIRPDRPNVGDCAECVKLRNRDREKRNIIQRAYRARKREG